MRSILISVFGAISIVAAADQSKAPALEWVKTVSGTGSNSVAGVATDAQGNFYIAGSTRALDFPTVAATQPKPGGSPLVRIDPNSGSTDKLYSPILASAGSIAIDLKHPSTIYATSPLGLARSTDSGGTWRVISTLPAATTINSLSVDPTDSNILYAATSPLGAFKSTNAGASWTAINNGIPPYSVQTANVYGYSESVPSIQVFQIWIDPLATNVLFATTPPSNLMRSTDGGASWSASGFSFALVGGLAFDPLTKGTVYAPGVSSFYRSADDGETWTALPQLPDQSYPIVIAVDPFHKGTLYGGSQTGLYVSTDSGQTWTQRIKATAAQIVCDPNRAVVYANLVRVGIVTSTDAFQTYEPITPAAGPLARSQVLQIQVAGPYVFALSVPSTDVFITKLDPDGKVVYSTYLGGAASDTASGIAVGKDGSVYVAGATSSTDFPVTKGAYTSTFPSTTNSNFVSKLNPDGSLAWSTYFADSSSSINAIALDVNGNAYVGGITFGGLPTTPGVYEPSYVSVPICTFMCQYPTSAFLTKFNVEGSALKFSTYISHDSQKQPVPDLRAIAVATGGDAYFASSYGIFMLNSTGSALPGRYTGASVSVNAIALDKSGNLFATGNTGLAFVATAGAFERIPPRVIATGLGQHAFVLKLNSALSKVLAATYLGGENWDSGQSIAFDSVGNVIVGGSTLSAAFPVIAPFQGPFSNRSGFIAELDPSLSLLLASTYLGDARPFIAKGAVSDGQGNLLVAGDTQPDLSVYPPGPGTVIANKILLHPTPAVRLDSVVNYASQLSAPLAPGETIAAIGSGFQAGAKLLLDGKPLTAISSSTNNIVAVVPTDAKTSGAVKVTVTSNGATSNAVYMPAAATSPGIYSMDGSGFGQGYILNSDGTRNSQSNPALQGSAITIFATGAGPLSLDGGFAVTAQPVAVFIDGFYANGIGAVSRSAVGLPGIAYELKVYVPDAAKLAQQNPDLKDFKFPPQVGVALWVGANRSQDGIALWIK